MEPTSASGFTMPKLESVPKYHLQLNAQGYLLNGTPASEIRLKAPLRRDLDQSLYFNIHDASKIELNELAENTFSQYPIDLFTLILSDPDIDFETQLKLPDQNKYYSWYCFGFPKEQIPLCSTEDIESISRKIQKKIDPDTFRYLEEQWKKTYIEKILKEFPETIRNSQMSNFEELLHMDNLIHHLFYYREKLAGHLLFETGISSLQNNTLHQLHFWVQPDLELSVRKSVHLHLWKDIRIAAEESDCFAGVAHRNAKSMKYMKRNGGHPIHLKLKRIECF